MAATIAKPGTDHAQLDVATSLYDKDENRGSGPAAGLCTVLTEYGKENDLARIVIHASDSAPLQSAENRETGGWSSPVRRPWVCHSAG